MGIYEPETYDIRSAVPPLIGRVRAAFINALDERLAPFDIKSSDYIVLSALAHNAGWTAAAICSVIAHDPGAMTRKIDALEERGLVRRVRSPDDRRAIHIELTAEGRRLYPKMLAVVLAMVNEFLHGFSKAEVRELEGMLKRILANAEASEPLPAAARGARS